jgi:hypothetical protein
MDLLFILHMTNSMPQTWEEFLLFLLVFFPMMGGLLCLMKFIGDKIGK